MLQMFRRASLVAIGQARFFFPQARLHAADSLLRQFSGQGCAEGASVRAGAVCSGARALSLDV